MSDEHAEAAAKELVVVYSGAACSLLNTTGIESDIAERIARHYAPVLNERDELRKAIDEHNKHNASVPCMNERPRSADVGLRFLADWFDAGYQDAGFRDEVQQDLRKWAKEYSELRSKVERLTRGGCGKPGHTTCTSDEGTCYCLTCQLESEVAAKDGETVFLTRKVRDLSLENDRLKASLDQANAIIAREHGKGMEATGLAKANLCLVWRPTGSSYACESLPGKRPDHSGDANKMIRTCGTCRWLCPLDFSHHFNRCSNRVSELYGCLMAMDDTCSHWSVKEVRND